MDRFQRRWLYRNFSKKLKFSYNIELKNNLRTMNYGERNFKDSESFMVKEVYILYSILNLKKIEFLGRY
jgi:hypothetical protein